VREQGSDHLYEFETIRVDVARRRLWRDGQVVPLNPKAFDLLLALIEERGRMIEKDELMQRVWPDTAVEENNLTVNMAALRKALGEQARAPRYILTIPGSGYRFVAEVREARGESGGLVVQQRTRTSITIEEEEGEEERLASIAVLPFGSLGAEVGDEYLGLGLADALITRFSHLRQVLVRPTLAVLKFAAAPQTLEEIGRELGVGFLLAGQVQRVETRLRVTVQLIRVRDSALIWGDRFDEPWTDVLAIQDSISEQVARALTLKLSGEQQRQLKKHETESVEAYRLYLKGRWHWNHFTEAEMKRGMECYEQAIALDPDYALAFAGLADAYGTLHYNGCLPFEEAAPKHRALAERALQIDPALAEAHSSLAFAVINYDHDWARAEQEFKLATQLNPGYVTAHHYYAFFLAALARFDEAFAEMRHAQAIDPLSPYLNSDAGWIHYFARQFDQAIEFYHRALEIEPNFALAHAYLGLAYERQGKHAEAIAELQRAVQLSGGSADMTAWLGYVYAMAGQPDEARRVLDELHKRARQQYVSLHNTAMIYAALGELDQAFAWLENAYERRAGWLHCLRVDPRLDALRRDARFADLLRRFRLTSN